MRGINMFFKLILLYFVFSQYVTAEIWSTSYYSTILTKVNKDITKKMTSEIEEVNDMTALYKLAIKTKYQVIAEKQHEILRLQALLTLSLKHIEQKEEILRKMIK